MHAYLGTRGGIPRCQIPINFHRSARSVNHPTGYPPRRGRSYEFLPSRGVRRHILCYIYLYKTCTSRHLSLIVHIDRRQTYMHHRLLINGSSTGIPLRPRHWVPILVQLHRHSGPPLMRLGMPVLFIQDVIFMPFLFIHNRIIQALPALQSRRHNPHHRCCSPEVHRPPPLSLHTKS